MQGFPGLDTGTCSKGCENQMRRVSSQESSSVEGVTEAWVTSQEMP